MSDPSAENRLATESSAYLRQHMHNPVDWYAWGEEALDLARAEDRPLLVSIGYSACHWCHVMAHESFEDPQTAELMNRLYVNVKVDREERPDVDQIYMDTVVRLTGHGGWPLTIFCTPDGKPFYGGTYFPPERRHGLPSFREVLTAVAHAYRERRGEVEDSAQQILSALAERPAGIADAPPGTRTLREAATALMQGVDAQHGGFGSGPKFPTPTNLDMLLAACDVLPPDEAKAALDHCLFTCRVMSDRGLYDHLGGGFHRYCVDGQWTIPHFEKMLYDQGLLLRSYAEVWRRVGGDPSLEWPIHETVEYLRRELCAPEGGYYASQDADSEGEEGRFYVWRPEQIDDVLGDASDPFCDAYGVTPTGNFEGETTHLIQHPGTARERFAKERAALLAVRTTRIPPATDTKRVASWNGYAISGLARAGSTLGADDLVRDAARTADFVLEHMLDDEGRLLRIFNDGRAGVPAFLDDHAALLDAFLDLHRAGADGDYLAAALRLAEQIADRFYEEREQDLFLTPKDGERLVHRPRSDHDGATPHASGLAVVGLLRAGEISGRDALTRTAERVIRSHSLALDRAPHAYPTLSRAAALAESGLAVAVVVGSEGAERAALAAAARRALRPEDAVLVTAPGDAPEVGVAAHWTEGRGERDGRATGYLCRGRSCSLPVHDGDALAALVTSDSTTAPTR